MLSHGSQSPIEPVGILVDTAAETGATKRSQLQMPTVVFGIGIATLVLYLATFAINIHSENDFYKEAWPPYQQLFHGHFLSFLRSGPAYTGSLVLRAPFALLAALFGAGARATYVATALPCLFAPALLAGWLAGQGSEVRQSSSDRRSPRLRPLDLFVLTPPAIICVAGGHPEEVLGSVLCVAAVLLAYRGSGAAAGLALGIALINKTSALVVVPLVFAVMPADRRLAGIATFVVTAAVVLVPVTLIRATSSGGAGSALGSESVGIFLPPQLLWWFGRTSWVAREGHVLLVAVAWVVTGAWWWLRIHGRAERPGLETVLMALALVFFLRGALDPWDNTYYYAPFMLAVMTLENPRGFPKLTWIYVVLLVVVVPIAGVLSGLGKNGEATAFAVLAIPTIVWFARGAFFAGRSTSERRLYAAASRVGT
jgi:hypothetical protein